MNETVKLICNVIATNEAVKKKFLTLCQPLLVLAWNFPLLYFIVGYDLAIGKLHFIEKFGFHILLMNERTERAIQTTQWLTSRPLWPLMIIALLTNAIYLFFPRKKPYVYFLWFIAAIMFGIAFYAGNDLHYLNGKIIGL